MRGGIRRHEKKCLLWRVRTLPKPKMREILYMGQTRFLPMLLDRKDRMSMASGFEVRVPYCDYRLVEYVWKRHAAALHTWR